MWELIFTVLTAGLFWYLLAERSRLSESQKKLQKQVNGLADDLRVANLQIHKLNQRIVPSGESRTHEVTPTTQVVTEPVLPEVSELEAILPTPEDEPEAATVGLGPELLNPVTPPSPPSDHPQTPPMSAAAAYAMQLRRKQEQVAATVKAAVKTASSTTAPKPAGQDFASLEYWLGTRGAVVLGAIAIALSGVYFVRYFAVNGMLTPPVRLSIATLVGLMLILTGQFRQTFGRFLRSGLVAAGVVTLYGAAYASTNLHHLLPDRIGFGLMTVLTISTIFLSIRHGQLVATLGLIGGMLTPALVGYHQLTAAQLLGYVALLQVGMTILHHRMDWPHLKFITLGCSMIWCLTQMLLDHGRTDALFFNAFIFITLTTLFVSSMLAIRKDRHPHLHMILNGLSLVLALILTGVLLRQTGYDHLQWGFLGLLSAAALILGRLREKQFYLPGLAAIITTVNIITMPDVWIVEPANMPWILGGFGVLFGLGFYACLWRSRLAMRWASMCAVSCLVYGALYAAICDPQPLWPFLAVMTGIMMVLAFPLWAKPQDAKRDSLAILAACVFAFGGAAIHYGLHMHHRTLAFAGMLVLLVAVIRFVLLPQLRPIVWLLMGLVNVRLLLNDTLPTYPMSEHLWSSWIGMTYLPVAVMAYLCSRLLRPMRDNDPLVIASDIMAAVMILACATLLVHHGFYFGKWDTLMPMEWAVGDLYEHASVVVVWLVMSLVVMFFPRHIVNTNWLNICRIVFGFAMVYMLALCVGARNPLWTDVHVGSLPVVNGLLYLYGVPMVLLLIGTLFGRWDQCADMTKVSASVALILAFVLISLEVRQVYHGTLLRGDKPGLAEMYTYSAAWLVFSMLLFGVGFWRGNAPLRYAGLAVMFVTIGKVFLLDTRHLEDIYRVLSFLCLGLCLFGVAVGYQKLVREKRVETS